MAPGPGGRRPAVVNAMAPPPAARRVRGGMAGAASAQHAQDGDGGGGGGGVSQRRCPPRLGGGKTSNKATVAAGRALVRSKPGLRCVERGDKASTPPGSELGYALVPSDLLAQLRGQATATKSATPTQRSDAQDALERVVPCSALPAENVSPHSQESRTLPGPGDGSFAYVVSDTSKNTPTHAAGRASPVSDACPPPESARCNGRFDVFGVADDPAERERQRRKVQAQMLAEQIEEQRKRKEAEKQRLAEEERLEELKLEREREQIERTRQNREAKPPGAEPAPSPRLHSGGQSVSGLPPPRGRRGPTGDRHESPRVGAADGRKLADATVLACPVSARLSPVAPQSARSNGRCEFSEGAEDLAERERARRKLQADMLAEQIEEQRRRKEEEKVRLAEEDRLEELKLAREREELEKAQRIRDSHEQGRGAAHEGGLAQQAKPEGPAAIGRAKRAELSPRETRGVSADDAQWASSSMGAPRDMSPVSPSPSPERDRRRRRRRVTTSTNSTWRTADRGSRTWGDDDALLGEPENRHSPNTWLSSQRQGDLDVLSTVRETSDELIETAGARRTRRTRVRDRHRERLRCDRERDKADRERGSDRECIDRSRDDYDACQEPARDRGPQNHKTSHPREVQHLISPSITDRHSRVESLVAEQHPAEPRDPPARRYRQVSSERGVVEHAPQSTSQRLARSKSSEDDLRGQLASVLRICEQLLRERAQGELVGGDPEQNQVNVASHGNSNCTIPQTQYTPRGRPQGTPRRVRRRSLDDPSCSITSPLRQLELDLVPASPSEVRSRRRQTGVLPKALSSCSPSQDLAPASHAQARLRSMDGASRRAASTPRSTAANLNHYDQVELNSMAANHAHHHNGDIQSQRGLHACSDDLHQGIDGSEHAACVDSQCLGTEKYSGQIIFEGHGLLVTDDIMDGDPWPPSAVVEILSDATNGGAEANHCFGCPPGGNRCNGTEDGNVGVASVARSHPAPTGHVEGLPPRRSAVQSCDAPPSPFAANARGLAVRKQPGGSRFAAVPGQPAVGLNVQAHWPSFGNLPSVSEDKSLTNSSDGGSSKHNPGAGMIPIGIGHAIKAQSAMLRELFHR
eukprot:TRINITY_DN25411_c0_g1_i1.p1 TRINITY_DN25411_c0_g1~~TRINITY_DN25411_c0_g1_i1.p1  ORF type:complete len:1093 (+),score=159.37 TRINITY_DN25411_c0_g1_i1:66-3344(+)